MIFASTKQLDEGIIVFSTTSYTTVQVWYAYFPTTRMLSLWWQQTEKHISCVNTGKVIILTFTILEWVLNHCMQ